MTPREALFAATARAAELMGKIGEFGAIRPGLRADLVLLDADPLEDIRNTRSIRAVIVNGRYMDRSALDQLFEVVKPDR